MNDATKSDPPDELEDKGLAFGRFSDEDFDGKLFTTALMAVAKNV